MTSTDSAHDYEDDDIQECEGWGLCTERDCPCQVITEITREEGTL